MIKEQRWRSKNFYPKKACVFLELLRSFAVATILQEIVDLANLVCVSSIRSAGKVSSPKFCLQKIDKKVNCDHTPIVGDVQKRNEWNHPAIFIGQPFMHFPTSTWLLQICGPPYHPKAVPSTKPNGFKKRWHQNDPCFISFMVFLFMIFFSL